MRCLSSLETWDPSGSAPLPMTHLLSALLGRRRAMRTHVSTTERLDALYTPSLPVASRFSDHFVPTRITDASGALNDELAEELMGSAPLQPIGDAGFATLPAAGGARSSCVTPPCSAHGN